MLVSSDFTHSDHVYNHEIELVVKKRQAKEAIIIPIILRPCDWEEVKFGEHEKLSDYEVLPQNRKPVTRWPNRDEAFTEIAQAVRQAVTNLREYAEERSMGIINPRPKSIYPMPNSVIAQRLPLFEDIPPNPLHFTEQNTARSSGSRNTNRTSNSDSTGKTKAGTRRAPTQSQNPRGSAKLKSQRSAQYAETGVIKPAWKKKPSLTLLHFSQTMQDVFKCDDINAYGRGFRAILLLFFLTFDVGGLTLVSRDWQFTQEQPMIAFVLSLSLLLLGVLNIYGTVALVLTAIFGATWIVIAYHYLPSHPLSIPIVVIAASFLLAVARFILFRASKKGSSSSRSR